jgi:hypothetical protein
LFAANDAEPEAPAAKPVDQTSGDLGQDAISALFAESNPASDETSEQDEADQNVVSALIEENEKSVNKVVTAEDLVEDEFPKVNLVQLNANDGLAGDSDTDGIGSTISTKALSKRCSSRKTKIRQPDPPYRLNLLHFSCI